MRKRTHACEDVSVTVEETADPADLELLRQGLSEHARPFVDGPGFQPLTVFARDRSGRVLGGVHGSLNWNWLDVSLLWVDDAYRGQGLGARLLRAFETAGRSRGCRRAHLNTFSFQAPDFYERQGYEVYAELPDYPPGHRRIFFRKRL